ncbi:MAG: hypothetical protein ACKOXT_03805, partial [Actinomycetota bacterium]
RVLTADQNELNRLSENSLHLIQSHDIDKTVAIFADLYRGSESQQQESADNLETYAIPIGRLPKGISRSLISARSRALELRERAEEAREDVLERIEEARDDFRFAAKRFEIRVRRRVKRAAERLRREDQ